MSRIDAEQSDVLDAVVTRLQTALVLGGRQCFPVARPQDVPTIPPGGDFFVTVAVGDGLFVDQEQAEGNLTEDTDVVVSAYTRIKTDSTGHDKQLLMEEARGLLRIKRRLLAALSGQDLTTDGGDTFLRQTCHARRAAAPDLVAVGREGILCGVIRVVFGVPFDWTFTEE